MSQNNNTRVTPVTHVKIETQQPKKIHPNQIPTTDIMFYFNALDQKYPVHFSNPKHVTQRSQYLSKNEYDINSYLAILDPVSYQLAESNEIADNCDFLRSIKQKLIYTLYSIIINN